MNPLPIRELRHFIANVKAEHPNEDTLKIAALSACHMLSAMFGDDWIDKHVLMSTSSPTRFFKNSAHDQYSLVLGQFRLINLAEMVFNLQRVSGVRKSLEMIARGEVEAGFTELEVGKLLHAGDRVFHFVEPRGRKGDDYDLEIMLGSVRLCCEAKCKIESTCFSERTLLDTLNRARSQLPKDRPGMIFVSLPQGWHASSSESCFVELIQKCTERFFRGTRRIVSVEYYSSLLIQQDSKYVPRILRISLNNANSRFPCLENQRLLSRNFKIPDSWTNLLKECA